MKLNFSKAIGLIFVTLVLVGYALLDLYSIGFDIQRLNPIIIAILAIVFVIDTVYFAREQLFSKEKWMVKK